MHAQCLVDLISGEPRRPRIDNTAKGCLTIFWETFTMIPCTPKHLKRKQHRYLNIFGSQIKTESSLKIEEAILWF